MTASNKRLNELKARLVRVERELNNTPIFSALTLGRGTQRLGHAMKKREGLAQQRFNLKKEIERLESL